MFKHLICTTKLYTGRIQSIRSSATRANASHQDSNSVYISTIMYKHWYLPKSEWNLGQLSCRVNVDR